MPGGARIFAGSVPISSEGKKALGRIVGSNENPDISGRMVMGRKKPAMPLWAFRDVGRSRLPKFRSAADCLPPRPGVIHPPAPPGAARHGMARVMARAIAVLTF